MAVAHTTVLALLGKNISFTVSMKVPKRFKNEFPDLCNRSGVVQSVIVDLEGRHEILVDDVFYVLSEIQNLSF